VARLFFASLITFGILVGMVAACACGGFPAWRNGPMIEASHPEQIELLPEGSHDEEAKPPSQPSGPAIAL